MSPLDVWFDVASPYSWFASRRVEGLARDAGRTVRWRPLFLGGLLRELGRPPFPLEAMPPARRAVIEEDLARQARRLGLPWSGMRVTRTLDAMRWVVATPEEARGPVVHRLFDAVWRDRVDLGDRTVLARVVEGLPSDVEAVLSDPDVKEALRRETAQALTEGVFGVPTFVVDGRLEFGADRLDRLGAWLGRPPPALDARPAPGRVEVFHDVASPYAYLGLVGLHQLAERVGCEVVHRPILLGALFKQVGTPLVPIATFPPARQRWTGLDLARQAEALGVPFRFPAAFPLRTVTAQRIQLLEPRAWRCLYAAAWGRGLDLGDEGVLREALTEAGRDGDLVTRAGEAREALVASTAEAVAAGVCGVPTFRVGGQSFWGQDRLDLVEEALRYGSP